MGVLDIGKLAGVIELEDHLSGVLELIEQKVDKFDSKFGGFGAHVAEQATAFFTAEAALHAMEGALHLGIETLKELTLEGAGVADVEDNFNHVTAAAGRLGEALLGALREGTHNTITDFELMKTVNSNLAAGLDLTDKQYRELATGGFALAQAKGIDVKAAFDSINDAMLTGRTRQIAMLTGKIDLAAAEEKFAEKLGTTSDRLTAEGKLEAARAAILESVNAATARLGDQTDGLDERVAQLQTTWKNFQEDLGKTVATSPVLMAGLDGIKAALTEAFGGKSEDLIVTIAQAIDQGAINVLEFSKTVVDGVGLAGMAWNELRIIVETVAQGIRAITYVVEELATGWLKLSSIVTGVDFGESIKALEKDMDRLYDNMSEGETKIAGFRKAQDEWAIATGKVNEKIEEIRQRMLEAQEAQQKHAEETRHDTAATTEHTAATNADVAAQQNEAFILKQTQDEIKKKREAMAELASSGKTWQETLKDLNAETVTAVKGYLEAGVSQGTLATAYGLTATQITAVSKALKEEQDNMKLEQKQLNDSIERWAQYHAMVTERSGTATDKLVADIERWKAEQVKSHTAAKTDTADFYDWLEKTEAEMYRKSDQERLEADTHSRAYFERVAKDARDAFEFARAHSDQFTQAYIDGLQQTMVAADEAAKGWKDSLGGSLDSIAGQVRTLSGEFITLEEQARRANAGFSYSVGDVDQYEIDRTPGGADALLAEMNNLAQVIGQEKNNVHSIDEAIKYAKDQARFNALRDSYSTLVAQSKKKGMREGGVGEFGEGTMVELHGREMIIPLDKYFGPGGNGGGGLGGVTNTFYINGTAADVARQVSNEIMRSLKQGRQFGAA